MASELPRAYTFLKSAHVSLQADLDNNLTASNKWLEVAPSLGICSNYSGNNFNWSQGETI